MFDVPQSKQKLRSKQQSKIIKIYSYKNWVSKTSYTVIAIFVVLTSQIISEFETNNLTLASKVSKFDISSTHLVNVLCLQFFIQCKYLTFCNTKTLPKTFLLHPVFTNTNFTSIF